MNRPKPAETDAAAADKARRDVKSAETGNVKAAKDIERRNPEAVEAIEQEASDGPEGQGLSR